MAVAGELFHPLVVLGNAFSKLMRGRRTLASIKGEVAAPEEGAPNRKFLARQS
jgi:hypothetical protein